MAFIGLGAARLSSGQALATLQRRCASCSSRPTSSSGLTSNRLQCHTFGSSRTFSSNSGKRPRFSQRLGDALRNSKIQWYQIPVGLGIGFLGLVQFYKVASREREKQEGNDGEKPKRRPRIRPDGPW